MPAPTSAEAVPGRQIAGLDADAGDGDDDRQAGGAEQHDGPLVRADRRRPARVSSPTAPADQQQQDQEHRQQQQRGGLLSSACRSKVRPV